MVLTIIKSSSHEIFYSSLFIIKLFGRDNSKESITFSISFYKVVNPHITKLMSNLGNNFIEEFFDNFENENSDIETHCEFFKKKEIFLLRNKKVKPCFEDIEINIEDIVNWVNSDQYKKLKNPEEISSFVNKEFKKESIKIIQLKLEKEKEENKNLIKKKKEEEEESKRIEDKIKEIEEDRRKEEDKLKQVKLERKEEKNKLKEEKLKQKEVHQEEVKIKDPKLLRRKEKKNKLTIEEKELIRKREERKKQRENKNKKEELKKKAKRRLLKRPKKLS